MKDFLGKEITVGCTIVYPQRQGSRLWLNKMIVTNIAKYVEGYLPDHPGKRRHSVKSDRCVIVAWPELQPNVGYGVLGTKEAQLGVGDGTVQ